MSTRGRYCRPILSSARHHRRNVRSGWPTIGSSVPLWCVSPYSFIFPYTSSLSLFLARRVHFTAPPICFIPPLSTVGSATRKEMNRERSEMSDEKWGDAVPLALPLHWSCMFQAVRQQARLASFPFIYAQCRCCSDLKYGQGKGISSSVFQPAIALRASKSCVSLSCFACVLFFILCPHSFFQDAAKQDAGQLGVVVKKVEHCRSLLSPRRLPASNPGEPR